MREGIVIASRADVRLKMQSEAVKMDVCGKVENVEEGCCSVFIVSSSKKYGNC